LSSGFRRNPYPLGCISSTPPPGWTGPTSPSSGTSALRSFLTGPLEERLRPRWPPCEPPLPRGRPFFFFAIKHLSRIAAIGGRRIFVCGARERSQDHRIGVRHWYPDPVTKKSIRVGRLKSCRNPAGRFGHCTRRTNRGAQKRGVRASLGGTDRSRPPGSTDDRSGSNAGNSGRNASIPQEFPPTRGRPRGSRLWACSTYRRGRTRTLAILAMSQSLSSVHATIRRDLKNEVTYPPAVIQPPRWGTKSRSSNIIYTILPHFSSRNDVMSPR
jgi:hypothetical protein